MEFLSLDEIAILKNEIHTEQRALFNNRSIITKTKSNQWLFFNDCIELLFNPNYKSKYFSEPATKLAQLKFEIENKLKNFYLKPGRKIEYVFKLVHKKELQYFFHIHFHKEKTIRQRYILRKVEGIWKIYEVIMPVPRTSVPHRRKYSLT